MFNFAVSHKTDITKIFYIMTKIFIQRSLMKEKLQKRDESLGLVASTQNRRNRCLNKLINFMDDKAVEDYSPEVGQSFLEEYRFKPESTPYGVGIMKNLVSTLDEICKGDIASTHHKRIVHTLFGKTASIAEDYLLFLEKDLRLSMSTINHYRYILSHFTQKMSMQDLAWNEISFNHVVDFLSSIQNTDAQVYACVKNVIHFAFNRGCMDKDLSLYLKSVKPHRKEALPSCYAPEEVMRVEKAVDRRTNIGKRDYAVILLASRLGLRSSDIRMLEFKNIDWDLNEIRIMQYKTKRSLSLPLLSDVGDAIIDYIKNARPQCNRKNIFLTCSHPYKPCEAATISTIVKRYFIESGVDHKGKHTGPHALRHSLATTMLGNGTTLPVISGVLGHATSESTMYYLGVDVLSLLRCSLDVPPVHESFYTQKGGILYE